MSTNGKRRRRSDTQRVALYAVNSQAVLEGPKQKRWTKHDLEPLRPLTPAQHDMFHAYIAEKKHIVAHGYAGTGKSLVAIFLALQDLLNPDSMIDKVIIVRSAVPTRELGHLPGTLDEKQAIYEAPYADMFEFLLGKKTSYDDMKAAGFVHFCTTSFVRGLTWDNAAVIVDESQNMNWAELDSVITRLGQYSKIILCGDTNYQCDLKREVSGFREAMPIFERMESFEVVQFSEHDIVRSAFVKSWIMARTDHFKK